MTNERKSMLRNPYAIIRRLVAGETVHTLDVDWDSLTHRDTVAFLGASMALECAGHPEAEQRVDEFHERLGTVLEERETVPPEERGTLPLTETTKGNQTMNATNTIRQITDAGLSNAHTRVQVTAKTTGDGSNNPAYESAVAELAEFQKHFAAKNAVVALASKEGFRRNSYAGNCVKTGAEVKQVAGFVRKNEEGKWETYSFAAVVEIVGYVFEG